MALCRRLYGSLIIARSYLSFMHFIKQNYQSLQNWEKLFYRIITLHKVTFLASKEISHAKFSI
jgi:hypothetical protein